jgi:hypothetical protein
MNATTVSGKWHFGNIKDLKAAVTAACGQARDEARQSAVCVFARAMNLATAERGGSPCPPREEAACPGWKKTWKEIVEVVSEVEANYPNVLEVYISGGFDAADSPRARWEDGNYEPWASSWSVVVWERESQVESDSQLPALGE